MKLVNDKSLSKFTTSILNVDNVSYNNKETILDKINEIEKSITDGLKPSVLDLYNYKNEYIVGSGENANYSHEYNGGNVEFSFKGRTLENLINVNDILCNSTRMEDGWLKLNCTGMYDHYYPVESGNKYKPDTYYTVVIDIRKNSFNKNVRIRTSSISAFYSVSREIEAGETGKIFISCKTLNDINVLKNKSTICYNHPNNGIGEIELRTYIIEGNYNKEERIHLPDYIEGLNHSFNNGIIGINIVNNNIITENYFNIKEPLRSLDKGNIKDEIIIENGIWKLIRRIGVHIFNGDEQWAIRNGDINNMDYISFLLTSNTLLEKNRKSSIYDLCDDFKVLDNTSIWDQFIEPNPYNDDIPNWCMLRLRSNVLSTNTVDGLKEYIKENNFTLYFVIKEPIIEIIKPILVNINKNDKIIINSNKPYPFSTHHIYIDKETAIKTTTDQISSLNKAIDRITNDNSSLILKSYMNLLSLENRIGVEET